MDEAELKRQRWLKIIVIALGILIVGLLGVVISTIIIRANRMGAEDTQSRASAKSAEASHRQPAGPCFGDVQYVLPKGARIEDAQLEDGKLVVRVGLATGETRILLFSGSTGQKLGSIQFLEP